MKRIIGFGLRGILADRVLLDMDQGIDRTIAWLLEKDRGRFHNREVFEK